MHSRLLLTILLLVLFIPLDAQVANDSCFLATDIHWGESYQVDFLGSTPEQETCSFLDQDYAVWYRIMGTGHVFNASICNYQANIQVFAGACDSLYCLDNVVPRNRYNCQYYGDELSFKSELGKSYYILCTTDYPTGPYWLRVLIAEPTLNDSCHNAVELSMDTIYTYNHLNASRTFESDCDIEYYDYADLWYKLIGTGGNVLIESLIDPSHPYYSSNLPVQCFSSSCGDLNCEDVTKLGNGHKTFATVDGETYYLRILGNLTSPFQFRISPIDLAINQTCDAALPLKLDDTLKFTHTNVELATGPCSYNYPTLTLWYTFEGNDSILQIETTSAATSLSLLEGDCNVNSCLPLTVAPLGFHLEKIRIPIFKGRNYLLAVHHPTATIYDSLSVITSLGLAPINNHPTSPIPLNCKDTAFTSFDYALSDYHLNGDHFPSIWYEIIGTGDYYTIFSGGNPYSLSMSFFTGSAGNLSFFSNTYNPVYLELDSTYLLNISSRDQDSFKLGLICDPVLHNDLCEQASLLNLSDTVKADVRLSFQNLESDCIYGTADRSDVWYKVSGDNSLYEFVFESESDYQFTIFQGNCDSLICFEYREKYINSNSSSVKLFLKENHEYFFRIHATDQFTVDSFRFYFRNLPMATHSFCSEALQVDCGYEIMDSLDFSVFSSSICEEKENEGLWYSIKGTDQYVEVYFNEGSTNDVDDYIIFELFRGACGELSCITDQVYFFNDKFVFYAELDVTYKFRLSGRDKFSFRVACIERFHNDEISSAMDISCSSIVQGYTFTNTFVNRSYLCNASEDFDFWFRFEGKGGFIELDTEGDGMSGNYPISFPEGVYTEENGELICEGNFFNNLFLTESDKIYFFRFVSAGGHNFQDYDYQLNISFSCHPVALGDSCTEAILLSCGDSVRVDNAYATDDLFTSDCQYDYSKRGLWFKFVGNGSFYEIGVYSPNGSSINTSSINQLYYGSCDSLICMRDLVSNTFGKIVFYGNKKQTYYLNLGQNLGKADLKVSCHDRIVNDECHEATPIACGDTLSSTFDYTISCDYADGCYLNSLEKRIWYLFEGTGDQVRVDLDVAAYNPHYEIEIYPKNCCSFDKIQGLYGDNKSVVFQSEVGVQYLITPLLRSTRDDGDFTLSLTCLPNQTYSICENAKQLSHGQTIAIARDNAIDPFTLGNNFNNGEANWGKFRGSGGIDTLVIYGTDAQDLGVEVFIDVNDNCKYIRSTGLTYYDMRYTSDTLYRFISTVRDVSYSLAIICRDHTVDSLYVELRISGQSNVCSVELSDHILFTPNEELTLHPTITGLSASTTLLVGNHDGYDYFENWTSEQPITFTPQKDGYYLLDYRSDQCRGTLPFRLVPKLPQPLACPDSVVQCYPEISHTDLILGSNKYRAEIKIESNSIVNQYSLLEYQSANSIELLPSFAVENGAVFTAEIKPCSEPGLESQKANSN